MPSKLILIETPLKKYSELRQEYKAKFCWIRKEEDKLICQHSWVLCRDFLADCIYLYENKNKGSIYCFKLEEGFKPRPYMAINVPSMNNINILINNLNNLHIIERANKLKETSIIYNNDNIIVVKYDPYWKTSPVLFSLYSFMLKMFSYTDTDIFNVDNLPSTEQMYLMGIVDLHQIVMELKKYKFPDYDLKSTLSYFHNNSGFVTFFNKKNGQFLKA